MLTESQVAALSPDGASTSAGRKLGSARTWSSLGRSERALFGECQGSALYQTRVDLKEYSSKCSCPSRKFPCKHALGLLFLAAAKPELLVPSAEPDWVSDWLDQRDNKAQAKAEKAQAKAEVPKPVDEEAQAKRAQQRETRIQAALQLTQRWLDDLLQQGLATPAMQSESHFETLAERLVDGQAPGIAERIRRAAGLLGSGDDSEARVLHELALVQLAIDLWQRREQLSADWQAELRQILGLGVREEDVLREGHTVQGKFFTLGSRQIDHDRVQELRTWLVDENGQNLALVLDFAVRDQRKVTMLVPQTCMAMTLKFYPGRARLRALIAERSSNPVPHLAPPPSVADFTGLLKQHAAQLARSPFARISAACVAELQVQNSPRSSALVLRDHQGAVLPLLTGNAGALLQLLADGGGQPLHMALEWDGRAARLLGYGDAVRWRSVQEGT